MKNLAEKTPVAREDKIEYVTSYFDALVEILKTLNYQEFSELVSAIKQLFQQETSKDSDTSGQFDLKEQL